MQKLQQILQRAIGENAAFVELSESSVVSAWFEAGPTDWPEYGTITSAEIRALIPLLFPNGDTSAAMRGQIEIPNFGTLLTIGVLSPRERLLLFLPKGHPMFDQAWEDLTSSGVPPEALIPDVAPPPPPPPVAAAPIAAAPIAFAPPAPPLPQAPATPSAPPVPPAPAGVPLAAPPIGAAVVPPPIDMFGKPTGGGPSPAKKPAKKPATVAKDPEIARAAPPPEVPVITGPAPIPLNTNAIPPTSFSMEQLSPASDHVLPLAPLEAAPIIAPEPVNAPDPIVATEPIVAATPIIAPAPVLATAPMSSPTAAPSSLKIDIEPGPKELDEFLKMMLTKKASDLHITSGEPIAMRVDGEIERLKEYVWDEAMVTRMLDPITPPLNRKQFADDNDTDFAYEIKGLSRFRVNLFRDRNGRAAVLRQIPNQIPSFEQLSLPETLKKLCFLSKGLVVVTGPTGSGKSTTLAALVDFVNTNRQDHILTLEDPIEFVHSQKGCLIRQREIHKHTTSFARALRAALREDPDIILIGELRDLETTALAIEIAETGHLVFGTLHTTTAISTIDRIIDQFSADRQEQIRTMLAESLKGVVAQTLLKKASGGRVAAQEILMVNGAVSSMIREGKIHMIPSHMQSQKADGNILLNEALMSLVLKKIVHPKDAWMKAVDKANIIERMRSANVDTSWFQTLGAA